MKTKLTILKLLVVTCTFATATVFGQIITWIGPDAALPGGANFGRTTNWSGDNGLGSTAPIGGTICTFDGTVPGNLLVYSLDGINGTGYPIGAEAAGANGLAIDLTPGQTGSVNFICHSSLAQTPSMGFNAFRAESGAGQLILGNNTSNRLATVLRPAASPHHWINDSTNPVIINPTWLIQGGGGNAGHTFNFQGTGGFCITNNLRSNNGPNDPIPVIWENTGTTFWAEGFPGGNGLNNPTNKFNTLLGPVTISAGRLVITAPRLFPLNNINGNTIEHTELC